MRLIAVTGGGEQFAQRVAEALEAGAEVLVRELALPEGLPLERVILHARMPGAAEAATALHLSADMDVAEWRRRFSGPLTVSAHSAEEAQRKRDLGADAVFLSPIFAARHGREALGTAGLRGHIALGGVVPERLAECALAGAVGVAVLGGIWHSPDGITRAVGRYRTPHSALRAPPPFRGEDRG